MQEAKHSIKKMIVKYISCDCKLDFFLVSPCILFHNSQVIFSDFHIFGFSCSLADRHVSSELQSVNAFPHSLQSSRRKKMLYCIYSTCNPFRIGWMLWILDRVKCNSIFLFVCLSILLAANSASYIVCFSLLIISC